MKLEIEAVSIQYDNGVRALQGVTLTIGNGLFGLLGPNGAGKSTLMRTLATLQSPDVGTVRFDGLSIFDDVAAHRRRLGYLPQDFGVYPGLSARELLDHLALLKGLTDRHDRREQVDALLVQVNLWDHRKRAVSGFSGGMRQRFGIAQALLGAPKLVIVDEPTAGLDPAERGRFYNLLSELGDEMVVILSTHIVEDVRQICTRMAIMADGRVVCQGVPDDLAAGLEGQLWTRTIDRHALADQSRRHRVLSSQLHAGRSRIRVLSDSMPEADFTPTSPTLEDVYFRALTSASAERPAAGATS
ncbi:MAG: ABC transporter ATP-binding protein [Gemmatimonadetes bacterium]|nr:ABC transporter ATP-binding protein [Gemmatimonadota bacterium]